MRVFIRVDASTQIGLGHLIRCRTLAVELRARGAEVQFICRAHPGHATRALEEKGFQAILLPPPQTGESSLTGYAAWLGVPQERDAAETLEAIGATTADWVIVDHYGLDAQWERIVRARAHRIMVIDDLANRTHDCDLLLDQNFGADAPGRYDGLAPTACRLFLGPRYALLSPEYREFKPRVRSKVERVLLTFGSADVHNATGLALEALSSQDLAHLHVDVVVGSANPHRTPIVALAERRGRVTVYDPRPQLADLIDGADLAIGAGGGTTWERLCLGLPTLVVSIADNQVPSSLALAEAGFISYAGALEALTVDEVRSQIVQLANNPERLQAMSALGPGLVDGTGALRMVEALAATPADKLRLRSARPEDAVIFFNWVNDPESRRQSLSTSPVPWAAHLDWFNRRMRAEGSPLFVLETPAGLPVGQIRFDLQQTGAIRLSYMLDPLVRGRGWASVLVKLGLQALGSSNSAQVYAEVKRSNVASCAVFERLGFSHQDLAEQELRIYRPTRTDF